MSASGRTRPCKVCGKGTMHQHVRLEAVEYRGVQGKVRAFSSICDGCGIDLADATDSLHSRREWMRFKKQVDGVPSGQVIAEMRRAHGLSQQQAGELFGGGDTAFSKYEHDDVIPDGAMVGLLKLAIAFPETVSNLKRVKLMPQVLLIKELSCRPIAWEEEEGTSSEWPSVARPMDKQQRSVSWSREETSQWMQ